jgi:MarR family 2-MHQ and catechol resistance regulon transcriptional repressor
MKKDLVKNVATDLFLIPAFSSRIVRSKFTKIALADMEVSLTPLHFEIMILLTEEGALPVAEIGKRLVLAKAHMTQLVDKLVEKEIAVREADPDDRRVTRISITEKGREILNKIHVRVSAALKKALSSLSENDLKNLTRSLSIIRDILPKMI